MRFRRAMFAFVLLLCGCAPAPQWSVPPGFAPVQMLDNPTLVPTADHQCLWEHVVDVVDDYFRIDREEPVRAIGETITEGRLETFPEVGATLLEPWKHDSVNFDERLESTLQSIRRRAIVRVIPSAAGYLVEVTVLKELEDMKRPEHSTAGAATLRYDQTLNRVSNPLDPADITKGWVPQGRDAALEQRMLSELHARFGRAMAAAPRYTQPMQPAPMLQPAPPVLEPVPRPTGVPVAR